MIKPVIGSIVKIAAFNLKAGMTLVEDDQDVTLFNVEIDYSEENAVSYDYKDATGIVVVRLCPDRFCKAYQVRRRGQFS